MPQFDPIAWLKKIAEKPLEQRIRALDELTIPQTQAVYKVWKILQSDSQATANKIPDDPASFAEIWSVKLNPNNPWTRARHLEIVSEYLSDLEKGKKKRILVSMAPRRGKSQLTSFWYPIWRLAKNPRTRIGIASYSQELAAQWSSNIRNFIRDYGAEIGVQLDPTSTAKHNWKTTVGGGVQAAGRGGPFTGFGFDLIICDDILKNAEEASSEEIRKDSWEWFVSVVLSRMEPQTTFCVVGTRWNFDDLMGRLEKASDSGEGLKWDSIKFPELAEKNDPLGRKEGEVLWPERFPLEMVLDQKKATPAYFWSALYQQSPVAAEGGLFKFSWWKYYEVLPSDFDIMLQSWDLSFKDLKTSDYTVGQVWGRRGAQFYLVDQIRAQMNAKDVIEAIKNFSAKYPKARAKLIEDKANGPAIITLLQNEVTGMIPVKVKASKETRAMASQPYVEAGNCYLPTPAKAHWINDFILELAQFPHGAHDDQLDAFTQAMNYLAPGGWSLLNTAHSQASRYDLDYKKSPGEAIKAKIWDQYKKDVDKAGKRINNPNGFKKTHNW